MDTGLEPVRRDPALPRRIQAAATLVKDVTVSERRAWVAERVLLTFLVSPFRARTPNPNHDVEAPAKTRQCRRPCAAGPTAAAVGRHERHSRPPHRPGSGPGASAAHGRRRIRSVQHRDVRPERVVGTGREARALTRPAARIATRSPARGSPAWSDTRPDGTTR